jgi:magnesium transporter
MKLRIMDAARQESGSPEIVDAPERVARPPAGAVRWIDLEGQDEPALALLRERFEFHPLALEDCAHFDQRPKLEEYRDYLFIVVHGFRSQGSMETLEPLELHAFLGPDYLITVHAEPLPEIEHVWKRAAADGALVRRGADFLYYLVVDEIVDGNFLLLDQISETLDAIEEEVLSRHERAHLSRIFALKRTLVEMRRVLSPQRDVFAILAKRGHACIGERTSLYFRDVYDHLVRIYEAIDTGRDLLGNALDAHLSMVAQRTNDVMRKLTLMSAVFLPLTFVTGFFGQNFAHLPFANDYLMYSMLVACVVIPGAMVVWFYRSRWLE